MSDARRYPGQPEGEIPPQCARRGCANPVKWDGSHGRKNAKWRRFCSRLCSGQDTVKAGHMLAWNRERTKQFYLWFVKDVMGPGWRSGMPTSADQLVALVRGGYRHGYNAAYQLERRRTKANKRLCVCGGRKDFYSEVCRACKAKDAVA